MKSVQRAPETEVRGDRRRFTAAYKARVLAEAEAAEPGEVGALLRREGLYSSHLSKWRRKLEQGGPEALAARRPGPKRSRKDPTVAQLERENRRLTRRLERAEKIIEIQKKLSELLGIELPPPPSEPEE